MGKPRAFIEIPRMEPGYRPLDERILDFEEVEKRLTDYEIRNQAARCMDCGIPFCHGCGCPLGNLIPEWNDLVFRGRWKEALEILYSSNNFPEFTGRVCPALCEAACTAGINNTPVSIRQIEINLIEKGYREGYIQPRPPTKRSGKKVAVIGSGPAGLAAADQLNHMGHLVTIFEQDTKPGGYLRYGIPDFKLDKKIVRRRTDLIEAEGVSFELGVTVGRDLSSKFLRNRFDVICLACGAREPRDLNIPGRNFDGIHFAMDFLRQQNMRVSREYIGEKDILATGKKVLVIGGGDTGSDCIGTSARQKAASITQIEILPKPPENRPDYTPWPNWPYILRTSSSHREGCERHWSILTKSFEGQNGKVIGANVAFVEWETDILGKPLKMKEIQGSDFFIPADLVLIAMGFTGPSKNGLLADIGIHFSEKGNIVVDENNMTSEKGYFAAGDIVSGASLVVRAMASARKTAENINEYLNIN